MPDRRCTRRAFLGALGAALAAGTAWAACPIDLEPPADVAKGGDMRSTALKTTVELPLLDLEQPAAFQTATFGLG